MTSLDHARLSPGGAAATAQIGVIASIAEAQAGSTGLSPLREPGLPPRDESRVPVIVDITPGAGGAGVAATQGRTNVVAAAAEACMRAAVIGTGYVGLVTGTCFSNIGHNVVCVDTQAEKIAKLKRGEIPIYEPGLDDMVATGVRENKLAFTTDLREALVGSEVCFIAVGTPQSPDGQCNTSYVMSCAEELGRVIDHPMVVVVKSTVPVGTCDQVREAIAAGLRKRGLDIEVDVVSNPEFLKEGSAIKDFSEPDRIVVGANSEFGLRAMRRLYATFVAEGRPLCEMDVRSSELTKLTANNMLAIRIAFTNEVSGFAQAVGANIQSIMRGVGLDRRIGPHFLEAGPGYGGSCFPKDVAAMAYAMRGAGKPSRILDAVIAANEDQKKVVAQRVIDQFGGSLVGKRVAVWGIAFKPETDDIREAPALTTIDMLTAAGATVVAYDPEANANARAHYKDRKDVVIVDDMYEAVTGADALCLITHWRAFREADLGAVRGSMSTPMFVDGRNLFDAERMQKHGFDYSDIGRTPLNR